MTPQERQLIDELFDRLAKLESAPRDPDAAAAISQALQRAPNAVYALVQTVLVQDEALKRANARIEELQHAQQAQQPQSGGFLDSMRDSIFGSASSRGSVPNVPPPAPSRPVWNSGQAMPPGYQDSPAIPVSPAPMIKAVSASRGAACSAAEAARSSGPRRRRRPAWSAAHCSSAASAR